MGWKSKRGWGFGFNPYQFDPGEVGLDPSGCGLIPGGGGGGGGGFIPPVTKLYETTFIADYYTTNCRNYTGASGESYESVHDAPVANGSAQPFWVGQGRYGAPPYYYIINRCGVFFDTSSLPDKAEIVSVYLSFYCTALYWPGGPDFNFTIVNGDDLDMPISAENYGDLLDDTLSFGSLAFSSWVENQWNNIVLNASGLAKISKIGTTKFGIRSSNDIFSVIPTGEEVIEAGGWLASKPKLVITYRA